jgi:hypothetical protein
MRKRRIEDDPVFVEFKRIWELSGDERMTRPQIASYFNRSPYWVQWMYVKTGCRPRTRSPNVQMREAGAPDTRLDYINEMQLKSSLVAITNKLNARAREIKHYGSEHHRFSRVFSNLRRIIITTEKRAEEIKKFDPSWPRFRQVELALENGHKALTEASQLVRK